MRNLKALAAVLVLVACGVAHAQWQTYSHADPAFSIAHPEGWQAQVAESVADETGGDLVLKVRAKVAFKVTMEQGDLEASVTAYAAAEGVNAETLQKALQAQSAERKVTAGEVNGRPCAWYQEAADDRSAIHTYLPLDKGVYRVSLSSPTALFEECLPGYQHMLTSLREGPPETVPEPGAEPGRERVGPDGVAMVWVPPGEFLMGSTDQDIAYAVQHLGAVKEERLKDERPQHRVMLSGYWIDKTEVTNEQYGKFLEWINATGDHSKCFPGEPPNKDHTPRAGRTQENGPQQPVVDVDWYDAYAYAAWAGKRLPTEAEWEKAARGTDGRMFPWGNQWGARKCNSHESGKGQGGAVDVGSYPEGKSPYGCLDMAGNVREWCADWYGGRYYQSGPREDPTGLANGDTRVFRGGSWNDNMNSCRSARRFGWVPDSFPGLAYTPGLFNIGFRCARTP